MEFFTIKDVERLSGIKAHTLRIWEQRYGLVLPHRKESKHRFYTNEDLREILRVSFLYNSGYKISRIAHLTSQLREEAIDSVISRGGYFEEVVNGMLLASKHFDTETFENLFSTVVAQAGLVKAMSNVAYPYLEKIGLLWMNDKLMPAQEHFGSQIIRHRLIAAIDALPSLPKARSPLLLLFTPAREHHEIPLLFVHYLLSLNGCKSIYLGANASDAMICSLADHYQPTHVYYHQITNFTAFDADQYMLSLCHRYPEIKITASGMAMASVHSVPPNATILRSLDGLFEWVSNLSSEKAAA